MVFSSSIFLLYFLPVFLLVYHLVSQKFKNYVILASSIFFYSWGAPQFVFILLASTIIDFYIVKKLFLSKELATKKIFLGLSISLNLGLLIYFKYANFFVENLNSFLSELGFSQLAWTSVILPIGISFYTFQTLTYSIDVYRKVHKPLDKITDYLMYIMSFPQMIAGPIVRFNSIADQIVNREETIDDKLLGLYRFAIGLAKKVLIANVMAEQVELIFGSGLVNVSTMSAWLGMLAYTFQIYFDFSGYSDMAIGLGRMIGFKFPENFNSPYIARNISDFWRRWHITLGDFMRNYLYIPLGGNRVSSSYRLYFNLAIVFLLSGLWHGASWNFVIWGAYHGLFLILDRLFLISFSKVIGKIPSILLTFFLVVVGWTIFKFENFDELTSCLRIMFSINEGADTDLIPAFTLIISIAVIFSFITAFNFGEKLETFFFETFNYSIRGHVMMSVISVILFSLALGSITSSGFNPFIYFRF